MIKCEVVEEFTLKDFAKLKNIVRKSKNTYGMLYKGDVFECDENMAKYLTGENSKNKVVVKILEVIPEIHIKNEINIDSKKIIEEVNKEKQKETKKKSSKKAKKTI